MFRLKPFPLLAALLGITAAASGQPRTIAVGKPLPTISATAASGRWLERAALNPANYGKVRGVSPAGAKTPQIVVYTSSLSEDFFWLAQKVDQLIELHPELGWSFVQVSDPKGAQRGGYTAEELKIRLDEIKALTEKHELKHLSFLVAAPAARPGDTAITLAYVKPAASSTERAVVAWTAQTDATKQDREALNKLISELSATIGK